MIFFKDPIYFRITHLSVYITNNILRSETIQNTGERERERVRERERSRERVFERDFDKICTDDPWEKARRKRENCIPTENYAI